MRELIDLLGSPTQEKVAKRLGVRREYISRVLGGHEPSEQFSRLILVELQMARLVAGSSLPAPAVLREPVTPYGAAPNVTELVAQLRDRFQALLVAAGSDPERLYHVSHELRRIEDDAQAWLSKEDINARAVAGFVKRTAARRARHGQTSAEGSEAQEGA